MLPSSTATMLRGIYQLTLSTKAYLMVDVLEEWLAGIVSREVGTGGTGGTYHPEDFAINKEVPVYFQELPL